MSESKTIIRVWNEEQINQVIEQWHEGRRPEPTIHEALGWTLQEYIEWFETGTTSFLVKHA